MSRHLEVTTPNTREFPESVQVIVCQTCLDLINLCISKESLPSDYRYSAKNILRFPGKFDSKHATSTYLVAPVSASTQHISNTNENKELSTNETDKLSSQTVEVDKTVDSHSLVDIACSISQTTSPEVEKISATTTVVELTGAAAPIETEGVKRRAFFRVSSAISPKRHRSDESDKKETECRVVAQGTDSKNSHVEPESSMSIADLQAFRDFLATK